MKINKSQFAVLSNDRLVMKNRRYIYIMHFAKISEKKKKKD